MPGEQALVKAAAALSKQAATKLMAEAAKRPDLAAKAGASVVSLGAVAAKNTHVTLKPLNAYKAERHAWTLEAGQFSTDITLCGRKRCIVWKDGLAVASYPAMTAKELDGKQLAEFPDLTGVKASLRLDPRPPRKERKSSD